MLTPAPDAPLRVLQFQRLLCLLLLCFTLTGCGDGGESQGPQGSRGGPGDTGETGGTGDDGGTGSEGDNPGIPPELDDEAKAPPPNQPPVLALLPAGDQLLVVGDTLTIEASASDPDGDAVTITAGPLEAWMAFDGSTLVATPGADNTGSFTVAFEASDGTDTSSVSMRLAVRAPPAVGTVSLSPASFVPGAELTVELIDADVDVDSSRAELVQVRLVNQRSGEVETLGLRESGLNTGVFRGAISTVEGAAGSVNDGTLDVLVGDTVLAIYTDAAPAGERTDSAETIEDQTLPGVTYLTKGAPDISADIARWRLFDEVTATSTTPRYLAGSQYNGWRQRNGDYNPQVLDSWTCANLPGNGDECRELEGVTWVEFDITDAFNAWKNGDRPHLGVLLRSEAGRIVHFSAKENADGNGPEICVDSTPGTCDGTRYGNVAADTFIGNSEFSGNGSSRDLVLTPSRTILVRFDDLPNGGPDVGRAVLRLFLNAVFSGSDVTVDAHEIDFLSARPDYVDFDNNAYFGLSSRYPNDEGIASDPNVLFAEDFESEQFRDRWTMVDDPIDILDDDPDGRFVPLIGKAARFKVPKNGNGSGSLEYLFENEGQGRQREIWVRYYQYLGDGWDTGVVFAGKIGIGIAGRMWSMDPEPTPNTIYFGGNSGDPGFGTGFSIRGDYTGPETASVFSGAVTHHGAYVYMRDRDGCLDPSCEYGGPSFGGSSLPTGEGQHYPYAYRGFLKQHRWYCVEHYFRQNDRDERNGVYRTFIDGAMTSERTTLDMTQNPDNVYLQSIWLTVYHGGRFKSGDDINTYYDNVVVATEHVGCIAPTAWDGNRPPVASPSQPADQRVSEGVMFEIDTSVWFSDPDGDALEFAAYGLPAWAMLDPATALITGTPVVRGDSSFNVTVGARDGDLGALATFEIVASDTSELGPQVVNGGIPDQRVQAGAQITLDVSGFFSTDITDEYLAWHVGSTHLDDGGEVRKPEIGTSIGESISISDEGVLMLQTMRTGVGEITVCRDNLRNYACDRFELTVQP